MNDNKLLLVKTAVDPQYRLSAFHSYLKNNIKEQLKCNVKKHISFEADQKGDFPILPPEKPKPQPSVNFDPKKFSTYFSLFEIKSNTATQEDEQRESIDEEIKGEIKFFCYREFECRN